MKTEHLFFQDTEKNDTCYDKKGIVSNIGTLQNVVNEGL